MKSFDVRLPQQPPSPPFWLWRRRRPHVDRLRRLSRAGLCAGLLGLLVSSGCATYQAKVEEARGLIQAQRASEAATRLAPLATVEGKDQLIYLLDYATALQLSGRYRESAKVFERAERIADIQDYHSISKLTSSLALSEEMIQYKGDDFEKVLINGVNAVNYLELGDLDGALVEVRRLNQKLYKFKYEAKRDYQQNPYAYYLGATIWEADRKWDDAYIAYRNAYELVPNFFLLREDLIRAAIKAQRPEEVEKWRQTFPDVQIRPEWQDPSVGEIVFVYQQGWGPRKYPRFDDQRFPRLVPVRSSSRRANVLVDGVARTSTLAVFNVEQVAIKTLEDDYGRLVASRLAGVAAKAVLADQLRQQNEALGQIAWIAMNVADRADLRQWSTLPETFQIARMWVKAGKYKVSARGIGDAGYETGEVMPEREVEVKPGRKIFVTWRSLR